MAKFEYTQKKLDESEALNILHKFDSMFSPALSSKVDIDSYSKKLAKFANWVLCMNDSRIIGYIAFYQNTETGIDYIPSICVLDTFRHYHIATQMLSFMMEQAPTGIKEIQLECRKNNESALRFYSKNGFDVIGGDESKYLLSKHLK